MTLPIPSFLLAMRRTKKALLHVITNHPRDELLMFWLFRNTFLSSARVNLENWPVRGGHLRLLQPITTLGNKAWTFRLKAFVFPRINTRQDHALSLCWANAISVGAVGIGAEAWVEHVLNYFLSQQKIGGSRVDFNLRHQFLHILGCRCCTTALTRSSIKAGDFDPIYTRGGSSLGSGSKARRLKPIFPGSGLRLSSGSKVQARKAHKPRLSLGFVNFWSFYKEKTDKNTFC